MPVIYRMKVLITIASILAAAALLAPLPSFAAGIEYANVTQFTDAEAVIRVRTFTDEFYYRCSISSRGCLAATSTTVIAQPEPAPAYMLAYRMLMPSGAQSLKRSPDGRYIAFYIPATQSRGKRTWGVMDTTNLKIYTKEETLTYWDLLTEGIRYYTFSPDSKKLIYISDALKNPTLYEIDLSALNAGGLTLVTNKMFSREYTVADVEWQDNDTIFFVANREGAHQWSLYRYTLSSGALTKISDNVSYDVNVRKVGSVFLFGIADPKGVRPAIYDPSTGSVQFFNFLSSNPDETQGKSVSLANGLKGVFLLEPSKNSDTLLVWLHGGPYRQSSASYHPYFSYGGYDWVLEKARDADVGVLKIDYPGSYGYGRPFAESLIKKVGVKDVTDTEAAIKDFAKRNRYSKVYLMGNSYGGYLAAKLLVEKPNAYNGAFSINGVADWTTMLTALDTSIFNVLFGGTVGDQNQNYDLYANASIYNHVSDLSGQHVILMHGDKDMTIPVRQSEGLATFMTQNQKPAELIKLAGEDHVYKNPKNFKLLCETTLRFVGRSGRSSCDVE